MAKVVKFTKISPEFRPSFSRGRNSQQKFKVNFNKFWPEVRPYKTRVCLEPKATCMQFFFTRSRGWRINPQDLVFCAVLDRCRKTKFDESGKLYGVFTRWIGEYACTQLSCTLWTVFERQLRECVRNRAHKNSKATATQKFTMCVKIRSCCSLFLVV